MPRESCNFLMKKPFAPALPAGMACALSKSGEQTESREVAGAVIAAPCDKSRRGPRWTGGAQGNGVCACPLEYGVQRRKSWPTYSRRVLL
jgi:hypothetical protein